MKGYLQLKTKCSQYFKSLSIQGIGLIGFLYSCLPAQGYSMEEGYQKK